MNGEYLRSFESDLPLPDITWQEMVEHQKVFAPWLAKKALIQAKNKLMSEHGPHLDQRRELAPKWLDPWINDILGQGQTCGSQLVSSTKIMPIDKIKKYLIKTGSWRNSSVLNVAGAEGHPGHRYAADYMVERGFFPIWVFEQDSYFHEYKVRKEPFLSLELRLSMWSHYFNDCILTVAPECDSGASLNNHYQTLFNQTGARYSLAYLGDPNLPQKINRGEFRPDLIIPVLPDVQRTTNRVRRLLLKGR